MVNDSTRKLAGLLMLILVSVVILSMLQTETKIIASQVIKNTREFDLGEKITIYEMPNILTKEQQDALAKYATTEFFQDDLPSEYKVKGERDLLAEQQATPQSDSSINVVVNATNGTGINTLQEQQNEAFKSVTTSELTSSRSELLLQESSVQGNIHDRGAIVKIAGKIEMAKPAPYFYTIHMTCCEMDTFRVSTSNTDAYGNFIIKIATAPQFPLGDWTVTIGTIGDDNKIIKHYYNFKLIDSSINFKE
ncbi:MAG: hypothetical protein KJI69_05400 [Patescibacteria group bacterium]|nr:hypothetical protein [Patescibacteria group bacterium]